VRKKRHHLAPRIPHSKLQNCFCEKNVVHTCRPVPQKPHTSQQNCCCEKIVAQACWPLPPISSQRPSQIFVWENRASHLYDIRVRKALLIPADPVPQNLAEIGAPAWYQTHTSLVLTEKQSILIRESLQYIAGPSNRGRLFFLNFWRLENYFIIWIYLHTSICKLIMVHYQVL
jgi:hypothetical protein